MFFEGIAWAQSAGGAAQGGSEQVLFTTVVPLALLFGIFYFLLIRPQTKKAQEHEKMLKELKRNDEVVTSGGIVGRIVELGDRLVVLEIASNVRVRVERPQITALSTHGKTPSKKEKGD
jgi:preprotein translocase subunit YajC